MVICPTRPTMVKFTLVFKVGLIYVTWWHYWPRIIILASMSTRWQNRLVFPIVLFKNLWLIMKRNASLYIPLIFFFISLPYYIRKILLLMPQILYTYMRQTALKINVPSYLWFQESSKSFITNIPQTITPNAIKINITIYLPYVFSLCILYHKSR